MKKIVIAIDGYSSCGKSTIAKGLAKRIGYLYVDSGAMYRAVTLYCLQQGIIKEEKFSEEEVIQEIDKVNLELDLNSFTGISEIFLNGVNVEDHIRDMNVSQFVSPISAIKCVREKVVALQRKFGKDKGIVMDGRDIGTNVFPDAELKIFMTADEEVRVQRRWKELTTKGVKVTFEEVKQNIAQRDYADTHRKYDPLRKAEDAVVLDNTHMTVEEQLEFVLQLLAKKD
jgi:cytidylate kinase